MISSAWKPRNALRSPECDALAVATHPLHPCTARQAPSWGGAQGCIGRGGGAPTPLQGAQPMPSLCPATVPLTPSAGLNGIVTDSNCPQPFWQPPPTACLTASGVASEAPSLLGKHQNHRRTHFFGPSLVHNPLPPPPLCQAPPPPPTHTTPPSSIGLGAVQHQVLGAPRAMCPTAQGRRYAVVWCTEKWTPCPTSRSPDSDPLTPVPLPRRWGRSSA